MRVLITGITGFVGPHLAEHIFAQSDDAEVWGMTFGDIGMEQLEALKPRLRLVEGNLTDPASLGAVFEQSRPDVVFHLAAASSVGDSWSDPAKVFAINVTGQINLFEAALHAGLRPLMIIASSGEIYGRACDNGKPVDEDAPLKPQSPYGSSKATQDILAYQYNVSETLPTIRLRLFNHTGPRRQPNFVASSIALRIAEIEAGIREPVLKLGNMDAVRDFSDVRDVVRAYWLVVQRGEAGDVYNVCSGRAISIREILDRLVAETACDIRAEIDPGRLRAADIPILYGSHDKLTERTGWTPSTSLDTTLKDLLNYWRSQIGGRS